jgi:hypothetical protein
MPAGQSDPSVGQRTIVEKIRGKRTRDIALPNQSGEVDDRILEKTERESWNPLTRMTARAQRTAQRAKRATRRR